MDTTAVEKTPPPCPGPDSNPHGPSRFTVPPGAVDTHAHIVGDHFVLERSYTPRRPRAANICACSIPRA